MRGAASTGQLVDSGAIGRLEDEVPAGSRASEKIEPAKPSATWSSRLTTATSQCCILPTTPRTPGRKLPSARTEGKKGADGTVADSKAAVVYSGIPENG